jgi:hypothetical protein
MRTQITLTVPGTSSAGRARFRPWRARGGDAAVEAGGEPVEQALLGIRQVDASNGQGGKTQLPAALAQVLHKLPGLGNRRN